MTELLTAAQMRAIEKAAIDSGEVTGLELMERAGRGVVEAILEEWPAMALTSHKAVVLCGPGNNGGDGFVVARLLKERGWEVDVFLYGDEAKLPVDAKVNCERWREMGEVGDFINAPRFNHESDLFVDALFGTGLTRPLDGEALDRYFACISDPFVPAKTVAVDIASGVCADSGRELTLVHDTIVAGLTVTFHTAKVGHFLDWAEYKCGKLSIVDIGLKTPRSKNKCRINMVDPNGISGGPLAYKISLDKESMGNKFREGHALILSGPSSRTGAARLAARGALRIGAGLVTVACPPDALVENAAQLNAIMLSPVADATALSSVLGDVRINALCLGPALGLEQRTRDLVVVALESGRKAVLDADALTVFQDDPDVLFKMLHKDVVLTPHGGEFARLFPDIATKLAEPAVKGPAYSKVDATREAAKRAGCTVLYKGADTVIADPEGRATINSAHYERSAPWLATAGSGDVLAGFITGLMARGFGPMPAAETAAWLHVECALKFGPGLIAEDLPEQLPKVFSDLAL